MADDPKIQALSAWFRTPLGRLLAEAERDAVGQVLGGRCTGRLVQFAGHGEALPPGIGPACCLAAEPGPAVTAVARAEALPFRAASVDVMVLLHALEWAQDPCEVLRQAAQILVPEGLLLVVGFNPVSLWGLGRVVSAQRLSGPPGGQYFPARRVRDWCTLLDLEPLPGRTAFFRPPLNRQALQRRLQPLERLGGRLLPWSGGVHVLVSRKRVAGLRPPGMPARVRRPMFPRPIPGACQAPCRRPMAA
ncbi:MAG: methyltransferase domain-containing protein [Ectothiorhodospiraceae bacterium]|nr:methyltransferase domain-containing protein [Ectothiorhodospiraceae bacterium]